MSANESQVVCRQFVANVNTQVIERHVMRVIDEVVSDDLDLDQMRELVKAEEGVERKKESIREELEMLNKSMDALEVFS